MLSFPTSAKTPNPLSRKLPIPHGLLHLRDADTVLSATVDLGAIRKPRFT